MKLRAFWSLVPGFFLAASAASGDTGAGEANPYAVIGDRNVFQLNPPPSPVAPEHAPVDLPKLLLSGFYKVGGNMRVLLAMPPSDQKSAMKFFNLASGERDASVEVVSINAEKGEVDIINSGTAMTLSLASNGVVAMTAPSLPAGGAVLLSPRLRGARSFRSLPMIPGSVPPPSAGEAPTGVAIENNANPLVLSNGGSAPGGAIVPGRNVAGAGGTGAPSAPGTASSPGGVTVFGGGSGGAGTGLGGVYVPPNPGSAAANEAGANVGEVLANPQNNQFRKPAPDGAEAE